ncbi:hypothetical protein CI109_100393 [Kwoniella shandongensis]|uniref:Uncharacterized protein n=1 Tax=Kwoniella shandongensis TaxID=1734106 RepID=A0A5M6C419_9TREE|nr:uncharacterized protein CI109_001764 [Kwoniella shandongensis]KAA5529824.1 hypothetical protein CI109_001764 [Kwoniella shandongensis]
MSHDIYPDHPPPSKEVLREWCVSNGVFAESGLEICSMGSEVGERGEGAEGVENGWKVVAKRDLKAGELLCSIPKSALLSTRSSSLPPLPMTQPPLVPDQHSSLLHLALCVLHEFRLEAESRWYGYLQSLPREPLGLGLPVFWGEQLHLDGEGKAEQEGEGEDGDGDGREGRKWLVGTEAGRDLKRKEKDGMGMSALTSFYTTHSSHLPATPSHPSPSPLSSFLHAYSLVCTRAFLIDLYHTIALVPFCDLFNHTSTPHTSLLSDDYVCYLCGSLKTCSHDVINNDGVSWRLSHLGDWERRRVEHEVDTVDMRVERRVGNGEEVWNSYGEGLGDGRLLVEWGFIGEEFVGDGLIWDLEDLGLGIAKEEGEEEWEDMLDQLGEGWNERNRKMDNDTNPDVDDNDSDDSDDFDDDHETLLCRQSRSNPHLLNLDQSGRISINLFAVFWRHNSRSTSSSPKAESEHGNLFAALEIEDKTPSPSAEITEIIESIEELEETWHEIQARSLLIEDLTEANDLGHESDDTATHERSTDSKEATMTVRPQIVDVAKRIRKLLQDRLRGMYKSDLTQEQLFNLRDTLRSQDKYQRVAMTLSINERGLIISAMGKWDEWLAEYGASVESA